MSKKKILLIGETWMSSATHYKGFDQFGSVTFHSGAEPLLKALSDSDYDVRQMPAHEAVEALPFSLDGLQEYDALLLSDVGSNSLLLHPQVWLHGNPVVNRLKLLEAYVAAGGALAMFGGYFSFQGIDGKARWRATPVERTLPVECLPYDDRLEIPEGFTPDFVKPDHAILAGLPGEWPLLLGANEVRVKRSPDVDVIAQLPEEEGSHPLLVTGRYGNGRTLAWTSDIGPHWLPNAFVEWSGYRQLWINMLDWLTAKA
ncbi:putative membrane protein [Hartmannibacter diazotrophicus]|uniref:Putative membrane protein n=1 Tax=Hartmannibacter diazotrophicus TaxID=1482074 RepID=A0A2C9D577_9HYPH|nr:glutamine amidotransferase [Hartmannibacter diazotrophicus]SON55329.1 putative membrane protein [Hartmannibacter diazotrophicus]